MGSGLEKIPGGHTTSPINSTAAEIRSWCAVFLGGALPPEDLFRGPDPSDPPLPKVVRAVGDVPCDAMAPLRGRNPCGSLLAPHPCASCLVSLLLHYDWRPLPPEHGPAPCAPPLSDRIRGLAAGADDPSPAVDPSAHSQEPQQVGGRGRKGTHSVPRGLAATNSGGVHATG